MEPAENLWELLKALPDEEWKGLRKIRDRLSQGCSSAPAWREIVESFSPEDVADIKRAIEESCEEVDSDGW